MKLLKILAVPLILAIVISLSSPHIIDNFLNRTLIKNPPVISDAAKALHKSLIVIDLHADSLIAPRSLLTESKAGHVDVPRLIKGNVAIQAFTTPTRFNFTTDLHNMPTNSLDITTINYIALGWPRKTWFSLKERALHQATIFDNTVSESEKKLHAINNQKDLANYLQLRSQNPQITAGFLGMEGMHPLEGDINNIEVFYHAGFRMLAPVHFFDNKLGGSAHGENKGGLTALGKQSIPIMEKLHMTLDLSHASEASIDDALKIATRPILISHTGIKGTCDSPRNLSDKHLKGIANTGGVIGIGFFKLALCGETLQDLINAIDYTVQLVGIDHVGLGSDFDGAVGTLFDSAHLSLLTDALLKANYSHEDIRKIMGENTLRVLKQNLPPHSDVSDSGTYDANKPDTKHLHAE